MPASTCNVRWRFPSVAPSTSTSVEAVWWRAQDLVGTDGVIINDANVDGASAERLRRFVDAGGGLLLVLGQASGWPNSAADMLPGTIGQVQDRLQSRGGRLGFLEYGHPVFEPFAGPRSGDFTGARFFPGP